MNDLVLPLFGVHIFTDGSGKYSTEKRKIELRFIRLVSSDKQFSYFHVYFTTFSWNNKKHGFICTDNQWIKDIKHLLLDNYGLPVDSLEYASKEFQGTDYVRLFANKEMEILFKEMALDTNRTMINSLKNFLYSNTSK